MWTFAYVCTKAQKKELNNKSNDENYIQLMGNFKLKILAEKIEPKVYQYEFLKP